MNHYTLSGPAYIASALINNDYSGLDESEAAEAHAFEARHGSPVSCGEEYVGRWKGLICMLVDYEYLGEGLKGGK